MPVEIKLTIKVLSDFHIGTGAGRGRATDAVFLTDERGMPYIPGSTIKGLANCQARWLASLYERLGPPPDDLDFTPSPYHEVFGGGDQVGFAEDRVQFNDAHVTDDVPRGIRSGRSARSRVSGRARPGHLFFFEDAPAAEFATTLTCQSDLSAAALLLLLLSLRRIEAIGGQRRRGKGRAECTVEVVEAEVTSYPPANDVRLSLQGLCLPDSKEPGKSQFEQFARDVLENKISTDTRPMVPPYRAIQLTTPASNNPVCWRVFGVSESPLTLAQEQAADNVVESADYISGTSIRGAVAWHWLQSGVNDEDPVFRDGIARELVCFGPLYPAAGDWTAPAASMPIVLPASFVTCKRYPGPLSDLVRDERHGITDRFHVPFDRRCPTCDATLSACVGYVQLRGRTDCAVLDQTDVSSRVIQRTAIKHQTQRGEEGKLFGVEAIPRGTWFGGYVWGPESLVEALLAPWREPGRELRVGKVRSRGHGRLALLCVPADPAAHPVYPQLLPRNESGKPDELGDTFYLTLYSDLIALDKWMRPITELTAGLLWQLLGESGSPPFRLDRGFVSSRRIGGFLGVPGVPRTSDLAIAAGSTWRFQVDGSVVGSVVERQQLWDKLQVAQLTGLGFRRGEGFGRALLNLPLHQLAGDPLKDCVLTVPGDPGPPPARQDRGIPPQIHQHGSSAPGLSADDGPRGKT